MSCSCSYCPSDVMTNIGGAYSLFLGSRIIRIVPLVYTMPDRTSSRNVFIYANLEVVSGFYVWPGLSCPSEAGIYRWLSYFIDREIQYWKIFPCTVEPNEIILFRFTPSVSGPALEDDSQSPIHPGNYCIMAPDGSLMPVSVQITYPNPFSDADIISPPLWIGELSFDDQVRKRDGRCVVTGKPVEGNEASDFTAVHIIPPSFHSYLFTLATGSLSVPDKPPQEYFSVKNGLLMASDVAKSFVECEIGIDVDDGYRIVQFHHSDVLDLSRCKNLIFTDAHPDLWPSDYFLREHFKLAVQSSVSHGGETDGFDPQWFNKELQYFLDDEPVLPDLTDERWNNRVGQEVRRLMRCHES
ncbi:hypothetical protein BD410DRAFT_256495 [Rickenella mellea]|uniref:HNH nuclease domain-containing protein n=1 Tax=Rickenella mellea TaxID=50990 RepID=A0A4Y7Q654_9AGAM|nr:hypothetical protein BD410DRAFT_256495 [Rickenella mellea]